jgi:hypothetical protein
MLATGYCGNIQPVEPEIRSEHVEVGSINLNVCRERLGQAPTGLERRGNHVEGYWRTPKHFISNRISALYS